MLSDLSEALETVAHQVSTINTIKRQLVVATLDQRCASSSEALHCLLLQLELAR